ncbi:MAG: minor capsid protein [Bosea sp. (in: a-proteobacteria)]
MKIKGVDNSLDMALWVQRLSIGIENDIKLAADEVLKEVLAALALSGKPAPENIQTLIDAIEKAAKESLAPAITVALSDTATMAAAVQVAMVSKRKLKQVADGWKLALETPIAATGDLLEPFVRNLESDIVEKLTKNIQISMVKNLTLDEAVREAKEVIDTMKRRDIEAVISTATQHAFAQSRQAVFKASGVKKVRCIATLDVRVCVTCAALDGMIKQLDKAPKYPLHPRCRCLTMPETELSELLQEGATRSSEGGYVPQSVTAFDYLRMKPLKELSEHYGPTIAAAIKKPDMTNTKFRQLALDKALNPAKVSDFASWLDKQ